MKQYSITKDKLIIVVVACLTLLVGVLYLIAHSKQVASANAIEIPSKYNCTALKALGIENIPATSKYYSKSLDRDGNGIACQG